MDDSLGLVTPEVVDIGTAIASPTKEPEVPVVVSPANGTVPASGYITGGSNTERAVNPACAYRVAPTCPRPFLRCGAELPKVAEVARSADRAVPLPTEEPKIAVRVRPTDGTISRTGNIRGGGNSQRSKHAACTGSAVSFHPCPSSSRRAELPKVIEVAEVVGRINSPSSEEP